MVIAKIPTADSWKIPAYLAFGNWNDCPEPEVHMMFLKSWKERFDADLMTVGYDYLEIMVNHPPTEKETLLALAREHFFMSQESEGPLSAIGKSLQGSRYWFFWWD